MVSGGSNSLVLFAACHASVMSRGMATKQADKSLITQPGTGRDSFSRPKMKAAMEPHVSAAEIDQLHDGTSFGRQATSQEQGSGAYQRTPKEEIKLSV